MVELPSELFLLTHPGWHSGATLNSENVKSTQFAFRPLASKKVLVWLAAYLAFFRILGFSLLSSLFLLALLSFLVIFGISIVRVVRGGDQGLSLLDTSDIQDLDSGVKKNN